MYHLRLLFFGRALFIFLLVCPRVLSSASVVLPVCPLPELSIFAFAQAVQEESESDSDGVSSCSSVSDSSDDEVIGRVRVPERYFFAANPQNVEQYYS